MMLAMVRLRLRTMWRRDMNDMMLVRNAQFCVRIFVGLNWLAVVVMWLFGRFWLLLRWEITKITATEVVASPKVDHSWLLL